MHDKAFNITKNPKHDECQRRLISIVYKCFDKNIFDSGIKNVNMSDQQLAEELRKLITRKFKKTKVHSFYKDNIWGAGLADMQLVSEFNKGIRFLSYIRYCN